ncbi:MAG TPA: hypothetical protein VK035_10915 [Kiloniellales bacterium]|nr:hypothetical protein [Kiloniellales bacterium]
MPRKRRKRSAPPPLPLLWMELGLASWETIARRNLLMLDGSCSPAEYQRMVFEKMLAAQQTALLSLSPAATVGSLLAPWHRAARGNSRRLRRK